MFQKALPKGSEAVNIQPIENGIQNQSSHLQSAELWIQGPRFSCCKQWWLRGLVLVVLSGIPTVHFRAHHQPWLVVISESNVFACLLSLLESHPFSFSNQLQAGKTTWKIRAKLYCYDFTIVDMFHPLFLPKRLKTTKSQFQNPKTESHTVS